MNADMKTCLDIGGSNGHNSVNRLQHQIYCRNLISTFQYVYIRREFSQRSVTLLILLNVTCHFATTLYICCRCLLSRTYSGVNTYMLYWNNDPHNYTHLALVHCMFRIWGKLLRSVLLGAIQICFRDLGKHLLQLGDHGHPTCFITLWTLRI